MYYTKSLLEHNTLIAKCNILKYFSRIHSIPSRFNLNILSGYNHLLFFSVFPPTHSDLLSEHVNVLVRFTGLHVLSQFVLGGLTWAEDINEVTLGPCSALLGASLCRLADSCFCCVLPCEKV